ncbi:MAG: outer membrane lipoprotein carrier protein LolA [Urechidicola sp.]|nr:outer membrane lipoprotein carrier protein LolA [Urechidicola sp.]
MKLKQVISTFLLFLFVAIGFGQEVELSQQESEELRTNIKLQSESKNTIKSEFVQLKHLDFLSNDIESSGMLYYKSPNSIKWEYQKPFKYSATFLGDKLYINDAGKKSDLDLSSNKAFKSLNSLVVRSVKGDLFDATEFEITYFKTAQNYSVHFVPKDKKLHAFISEFVIGFSKTTFDVISVKMFENTEDYTLLIFKNQEFNNPISDAVFTN